MTMSQLNPQQIQAIIERAPIVTALPDTILHTTNDTKRKHLPQSAFGYTTRDKNGDKVDDVNDDDIYNAKNDTDNDDDDDKEIITTSQVLLLPDHIATGTAASNGSANAQMRNSPNLATNNDNGSSATSTNTGNHTTTAANLLENNGNNVQHHHHHHRRPAWISIRFYKATDDVRLGIRWQRQISEQSLTTAYVAHPNDANNHYLTISRIAPTGAIAACPLQVSGGDESVIPIQVGDRLVQLDDHIITPNIIGSNANTSSGKIDHKKKPREWQVKDVAEYIRTKTGWIEMLLFNPLGDPDLSQACVYRDHLKDTESLGLTLSSSYPSSYYLDQSDEGYKYTGSSNKTMKKKKSKKNDVDEVLRIEGIDTHGLLGGRSVAKPGDYIHGIHHMSAGAGMEDDGARSSSETRAASTAATATKDGIYSSDDDDDDMEDGRKKTAAAAPDLITFTVTNGNNTIYINSLREMFATMPRRSSSRRLLRRLSLTAMTDKNKGDIGLRYDHIDEEESSQDSTDSSFGGGAAAMAAAAAAVAAAADSDDESEGSGTAQRLQKGKDDFRGPDSRDDEEETETSARQKAAPTSMDTSSGPADNGPQYTGGRRRAMSEEEWEESLRYEVTATEISFTNQTNMNFNPTTTTTTTSTDATNGSTTTPDAPTPLPQPRYVSVSLEKTKGGKLGLVLTNYKDGTLVVKRNNPGGILSGSSFQAGCRLLSINNLACQAWTYVEALKYLRTYSGRLVMVGEYPTGEIDCLQATIYKDTPTSPAGLTFHQQHGLGLLRISRINASGALAHSVIGVGDSVLAVNGINGDGMAAKQAAMHIKASPQRISILTRTSGSNTIVIAKVRSGIKTNTATTSPQRRQYDGIATSMATTTSRPYHTPSANTSIISSVGHPHQYPSRTRNLSQSPPRSNFYETTRSTISSSHSLSPPRRPVVTSISTSPAAAITAGGSSAASTSTSSYWSSFF